MQHLERAAGERELGAVGQRVGDRARAAPGAERARDGAQRGHDVAGDAVAQHQPLGELVVALGLLGEVLEHRREQIERADLGARAPSEDVDQAEVVDVLVGDDDAPQVLDAVAVHGQGALELVERLARVRARVDERQRLVLDQVAVDAPDRERGRDRQAVVAGGRDVDGHERMRPSTSSRLASISSCETSDSSVSRSSGSVLEGRTLKCQSS